MTDTNNELAVILQEQVDLLTADHDHHAAKQDKPIEQWLPDWYLGKVASIDAIRNTIKDQFKAMMAELDSQEQSLQYRWGEQFRSIVHDALAAQTGKKKSVNYLTGKAGWRKTPAKLTIIDAETLQDWCLENCPDAMAVKIARTTPIKEHVEKTGEVPPGAHYREARDKFYPEFELPKLEAADKEQP